jgi:hypothetical protein
MGDFSMKERYTEEDIAKDGYFERVEDAVNPEEIIEEVLKNYPYYMDKKEVDKLKDSLFCRFNLQVN